jgi:serine/threonine protein kinase
MADAPHVAQADVLASSDVFRAWPAPEGGGEDAVEVEALALGAPVLRPGDDGPGPRDPCAVSYWFVKRLQQSRFGRVYVGRTVHDVHVPSDRANAAAAVADGSPPPPPPASVREALGAAAADDDRAFSREEPGADYEMDMDMSAHDSRRSAAAEAAALHTACAATAEYRADAPLFKDAGGRRYAIKCSNKAAAESAMAGQERPAEDAWREAAVLQLLNDAAELHPNVQEYCGCYEDESWLFLVTPLYETDMLSLIDPSAGGGPVTEAVARRHFEEVLAGVSYLHAHGVWHRDISVENVLLRRDADGSRRAVIIDFGAALTVRLGEDGATPMPVLSCGWAGKVWCMSPEVYRNENPIRNPFLCDVWACGVLLFTLLAGVRPYDTPDQILCGRFNLLHLGQLDHLFELLLTSRWTTATPSHGARHLMGRLLCSASGYRITLAQAREHAWLAGDGDAASGTSGAAGS